jgi:hypothetical protein
MAVTRHLRAPQQKGAEKTSEITNVAMVVGFQRTIDAVSGGARDAQNAFLSKLSGAVFRIHHAGLKIEDGKLQLSVYTMKGDKFFEVIVEHKTRQGSGD